MNIGYGLDNPDQGSLISLQHRDSVHAHVEAARARRLETICGGKPVEVEGYAGGAYYAPTLIDNISNQDIDNIPKPAFINPLIS